MILQNLVFPKKNLCHETELYIHTQEGELSAGEEQYLLAPGCEVDFLTYFNSFSADKWKKYTDADEVVFGLFCQGNCEISLWEAVYEEGCIATRCLHTSKWEKRDRSAGEQGMCRMAFSCTDVRGLVYATVKAETETVLSGGFFETGSEIRQNPVELAVGICTYRREEFVMKTLDTLKRSFIENERSPLRRHLRVYLSDNGQTLPAGEMSDETIRVMKNKNAGGAGGFGRCMLEAVKDRDRLGLTHMLLMDDDIVLEPESLFRTYALLTVLKPEYRGFMIGGGLLRLDLPFIQHANGETWNGGTIGFTKRGYDLRCPEDVLRNEEEQPVEYNGWWYCCLPLKDNFKGLPLPVFIHRDDIEYGLRFDGRILTLNGIGVWHDAFEHRKASPMEYYDLRNALITCAFHNPELSCLHIIKWMWRHLLGQMLRFRTEDQLLTLRGIEDFCKGVRFLRETDPCELHADLMKMGYMMQDVTDDLEQLGVDPAGAKPSPEHVYEQTGFSKKHLLSVNGWLLPGRREVTALPMGDHPDALYRCKRVLLYDPDTRKGFYVTRKRKDLFVTFGRMIQTACLLMRRYKGAVTDFQEHGAELTCESFWEEYLRE